jgi:hypothetical protein
MVHVERVRLMNPHKRKSQKKRSGGSKSARAGRSKHRRHNSAEMLSLGFLNPHRSSKMASPKKKRKGSKKRYYGFMKKRKSNPYRKSKMSHHHRRRRRNPGMFSNATSILKSGFYALVGLVVARQIPQWALGANNTSWIGYGANIVTTLLASWLAHKMLGTDAGNAVALGGGLYVVNRFIQDNLSPVGQVLSISGLGDYNALGDIQAGYFPLPVPTDASGNPIIPSQLQPAPMPAAAGGKGMGGINRSTRYTNRF